MAIVAGCEDAGKRIGDDIDVFTKDTIPILDFFRKGILATTEDVEKAGRFPAKASVIAARKDRKPPLQHVDQPCNEE